MSTSITAHEEPHMTIRLEYYPDEGEGELALAKQSLAAVDAVATGWLEPLAWELAVGCLDTELMHAPIDCQPAHPYWLVRIKQIPSWIEIRPFYGGHLLDTEMVLSTDQLHAWIARALMQTCANAPRFIPCWRRFWSLAMRARLPEAMSNAEHQDLSVNCYAGTLAVPLERTDSEVWVSGRPDGYVIGPPVSLTVRNEDSLLLTLDLAVYWSIWIDDPAGRAMVDAAVERVIALDRGWQRSEE